MQLLVVAALLLAVGYVLTCTWWPFASCRWCKGTGRWRSPGGQAWRPCGWCGGRGTRVRLGRYVYELVRGDRDE